MCVRVLFTTMVWLVLGTSYAHITQSARYKRQGPNSWCKLPRQPTHGLFTFEETHNIIVDESGIYLPSESRLSYSCDTGYGTSSSQPESVCDFGEWTNSVDCIKMCPPLISSSVEIVCDYAGWDVACNKTMWPKTKASVSCKGGGGSLPVMHCREDGVWDQPIPSCTPECGISLDPDTHTTLIVGGSSTRQGEFPWLAALYLQTPSDTPRWTQKCGGTLISPNIVLTAAHCLVLKAGRVRPADVKVGLGKYLRDYYMYENDSVIVDVKEVVTPEGYGGASGGFALDIGLLALVERVRITPYIRPACVDWSSALAPHTGDIGHVAGWGTTENGTSSETILSANLTYLTNAVCRQYVRLAYKVFVTDDKFCAGTTKGAQVNKGDSGGGLTVLRGEQHYVVGIVSSKISQETAFSLFTDILHSLHRQWLKRETERLDRN